MRRSTVWFALLLAVFAAGADLCHIATLHRRDGFPAEEDILYLPKTSALRAMSLRHTELVASLVFIRALVYFGGEITSPDKRFTWLENYLQTIVDLDPHFELAYRWAGSAIMYNGRTITNESVQRSNYFLEQGARHFPKSWQLPWMIGCNYLFELHTSDAQQQADWERIGAEWLRQAGLLESAPPWASLLAAQIMRKEGRQEASLKYLEEIYLTTNDDTVKTEIRNRMKALRQQVEADGLERETKAFAAGWQAALPYAHPDWFVLMGPRPSSRLDPEWLSRDELLIAAQKSEEEMRQGQQNQ